MLIIFHANIVMIIQHTGNIIPRNKTLHRTGTRNIVFRKKNPKQINFRHPLTWTDIKPFFTKLSSHTNSYLYTSIHNPIRSKVK